MSGPCLLSVVGLWISQNRPSNASYDTREGSRLLPRLLRARFGSSSRLCKSGCPQTLRHRRLVRMSRRQLRERRLRLPRNIRLQTLRFPSCSFPVERAGSDRHYFFFFVL